MPPASFKCLPTAVLLLCVCSATAGAQDQSPITTTAASIKSIELTFRADAQLGGIAQANSWWNLDQVFKPEVGYAADRAWMEPWAIVGVKARKPLGAWSLYGGVSALGSATVGKDVFDSGNTGRVTIEEAFVGAHFASSDKTWTVDGSGGSQDLSLGNGFLLKGGGSNGGERGAGAAAPRTAWQQADVLKLGYRQVTGQVFTLVPDQKDPANDTRLVGGQVDIDSGWFAGGVLFINAPHSTQAYAMAPVSPSRPTRILRSARTGLRVYGFHGRTVSVPKLSALSFKVDYALEQNHEVATAIDMRAWAWAAQVGYRLEHTSGKPLLTFLHMAYSGDNPSTPARVEGFDALYPDRLTTGFQMGAMAAFLFTNSNNVAERFGVDLRPSRTSRLEVYAWHIRAQQLNSPLSFGQGDRVDPSTGVLLTGVQDHHLTDDVVVMYTHVFSRQVILSLGASASWPGAGIDQLGLGRARMSYGFAPNLILRL